MTLLICLPALVLTIAFSGFFSGCETGLYCLNRLRLQLHVKKRRPDAMRLDALLQDEQAVLSSTLVGTNLMSYATTTLAATAIAGQLGHTGTAVEVYTTLLVTPVLFVFGEVVPKNLFRLHADTLMRWGSSVLLLFHNVFRFSGVVPALTRITRLAERWLPAQTGKTGVAAPKQRVAAMLRQGLMDLTTETETELSDVADRVVTLSETPLHRVMIPRNQVVTILAQADRHSLVKMARSTSHSRLPVLDRAGGQVVGVIKIDELLKDPTGWSSVQDNARDAFRLSSQTTVASAIAQARKTRHTMIVVVDRRDRMVGIATLKDLLEEIVGELSAW